MDRALGSEFSTTIAEFFHNNNINCENCSHEVDCPKHCISPLTKESCAYKKFPILMFDYKDGVKFKDRIKNKLVEDLDENLLLIKFPNSYPVNDISKEVKEIEELTHKKVLAVYSNIEVKSTKNLNEIKEYLENVIGYEINFGKKIGD